MIEIDIEKFQTFPDRYLHRPPNRTKPFSCSGLASRSRR